MIAQEYPFPPAHIPKVVFKPGFQASFILFNLAKLAGLWHEGSMRGCYRRVFLVQTVFTHVQLCKKNFKALPALQGSVSGSSTPPLEFLTCSAGRMSWAPMEIPGSSQATFMSCISKCCTATRLSSMRFSIRRDSACARHGAILLGCAWRYVFPPCASQSDGPHPAHGMAHGTVSQMCKTVKDCVRNMVTYAGQLPDQLPDSQVPEVCCSKCQARSKGLRTKKPRKTRLPPGPSAGQSGHMALSFMCVQQH